MGGALVKPDGPVTYRIPQPGKKDESDILRNILSKDKLVERIDDDVKTLYDAFNRTVKRYPHNKYLGWRVGESPFKWMSYSMAATRSRNIGSGLRNLGLVPKQDFVGIYSINRPEWMLTHHGADAHSLCLVPLYDTLGPDVVQFIVNQASLKVVFSSGDKVKTLIDAAKVCKSLKTIVSYDDVSAELKEAAKNAGVALVTLEQLEEDGKNKPQADVPPSPDDLQTIMYTSGTTGDPKGVMLTHQNLLANLAGVSYILALTPEDVHISYLLLAHSFERLAMNNVFYNGACAGFYRGDVRLLFEDIAVLAPTLFISVPRLWNRLYDKVMAAVNSGGAIKKTLFETAYEAKVEGLKEGYITHAVWDKVVFGAIKARLGGRVRLMVSGAAPLSEAVHTFLRVCFGVPVLEGYGQTESSAALCAQAPWDVGQVGHVGFPITCCELKLVDVPQMDYLHTDKPYPRGEICYRGPCACKGYYKNKEKTDELIDKEGWYHTGDVGVIDDLGRVKIIDRSKNIFKISLGEYIAPEKLENIFVQSKWVAQNWVYGDSLKSRLVGVAVPDFEVLQPWAKDKGHKDADKPAELCKDPAIIKMILDDMNEVGKTNKIRSFESLAAVTLVAEPFSVQNDLLTPTFKIKRPQCKKAFQAQLDAMYKDID